MRQGSPTSPFHHPLLPYIPLFTHRTLKLLGAHQILVSRASHDLYSMTLTCHFFTTQPTQCNVLTLGSFEVWSTSQSSAPSAAAKLHDSMLTVMKARMICHHSHAAASGLSRPETHVICDVEEPWGALKSPGEPSGALGSPGESPGALNTCIMTCSLAVSACL